MKKKLLVTASTFPRWKEDTEPRFILDLSKALNKYFDVTVLVPACPGAKEKEILEGVKVIRYHYFPVHKLETLCYPGAIVPRIKEKKLRILLVPFLFLGLWMKLFKILSKYDIVHAHWLIPQGIVQSFFKKPYLITGHGGDVTSLNMGMIRKLKIRALNKASAITVVSHALKKEINILDANLNVEIQSMGCDVSTFDRENRVENYFSQENKKVILFVGRLAEKKGVSYLIDAVKQLDVKLVIVGSGPLEQKLKKQAQVMGDKVVFLGAKPHYQLKVIYASADIFVAPSVTARDGDKEGVPTTIIEAMASGLPVVATRHSGIPELVSDGVNGFLVEERDVEGLKEKIEILLEAPDIREEFIKNGLQKVKKLSYEYVAANYANLLNRIFYE